MSTQGVSRRYFFFGSLLAGAVPRGGFGSVPTLRALGYKPFYNKLNVAAIGCGGQGGVDLNDAARSENIVALCDVDEKRAAQNLGRYDKAPKYKDFRVMLDKEGKNIDACTIGIPDFMHATVALACMQHGKHVYLEKPLTRTPWEARLLQDAAVKYKVATQMGNQGFSHECNRVAAEMVWSGAIGDVTEAHFSTSPGTHPTGLKELPPSGCCSQHARLGPVARRPPPRVLSARNMCRTTGAGFWISAPGRSATGQLIRPGRCKPHCNWVRPPAWNAFRWTAPAVSPIPTMRWFAWIFRLVERCLP